MQTDLKPPPGMEVEAPESIDESVDVIPYNADFDPNSDKFLPYLWNRLKEDGLTEIYFPAEKDSGFAKFVKLLSGAEQVVLVLKRDDEKVITNVIGFASWAPLPYGETNSILAGFIFLKEFWDRNHSVIAAKKIMDYWFNEGEIPGSGTIDLAVGFIAKANIPAQRFLSRIGWVRAGEIPDFHQHKGEKSDAVFWHITKTRHKEVHG